MGNARWKARRHGPLAKLAEGLYEVVAELELLPIGRRMVVFQLADGGVALHSVIACDAPTMQAIEALGEPRYVLVPSAAHAMDAPAYAARYPGARVLTPPAGQAKVGRRVRVDGDFSALVDAHLRHEPLDGVPAEAVFVHTDPRGASTLVFNDALMNLPDRLPGFGGLVTRLIGSTGGPKVTRTALRFIVEDRARLAAHLERLASTPGLARILVGHGANIESEPAEVLRRVAAALANY